MCLGGRNGRGSCGEAGGLPAVVVAVSAGPGRGRGRPSLRRRPLRVAAEMNGDYEHLENFSDVRKARLFAAALPFPFSGRGDAAEGRARQCQCG